MTKKTLFLVFVIALIFSVVSINASNAQELGERLKGKLLLQVEGVGEIWYVDTNEYDRYRVTWENALPLFRKLSLGITNDNLLKIPANTDSIDPNLDSDGDGYPDKTELTYGFSPYGPPGTKFNTSKALADRLKGKLLLQVEQGGRIWYVHDNGYRYQVTTSNLMDLFRKLSLGITNENLNKITVGSLSQELISDNFSSFVLNKDDVKLTYPFLTFDEDEFKKITADNLSDYLSYERESEMDFGIIGGYASSFTADLSDITGGENSDIRMVLTAVRNTVLVCNSLSAAENLITTIRQDAQEDDNVLVVDIEGMGDQAFMVNDQGSSQVMLLFRKNNIVNNIFAFVGDGNIDIELLARLQEAKF